MSCRTVVSTLNGQNNDYQFALNSIVHIYMSNNSQFQNLHMLRNGRIDRNGLHWMCVCVCVRFKFVHKVPLGLSWPPGTSLHRPHMWDLSIFQHIFYFGVALSICSCYRQSKLQRFLPSVASGRAATWATGAKRPDVEKVTLHMVASAKCVVNWYNACNNIPERNGTEN